MNTKQIDEAINANGIIEETKEALDKLGIREGTVHIMPLEPGRCEAADRYKMYINNRLYGIWDGARKTFVD